MLETQEELELPVNSTNQNNSTKSSFLAENRQIEDTPFVLRKRERGYFLTIGDTRITEPTETEEETINKLFNEKWKIIAAMIVHVVKILNENNIETHLKDTDNQ